MNETMEIVEASGVNDALYLAVIVVLVIGVLYGFWIGRLTARPSSQQRSTLRKALERHMRDLEREGGKDTEEYRVAAQLRHGRTLREKYD